MAESGRNLRIPVASVAGILLLAGWIASAMVLGDYVRGRNAAVQFVFYAAAGFLWVFPVRWLMLWSVHQR